MNYKTIIIILTFCAIGGCRRTTSEKRPAGLDKIYVGLNAPELYKQEKKDSFKYLSPPPPPPKENIANNAFIESKDGRVFFYTFPKRPPLCGYVLQDDTVELYQQDLDTLTLQGLTLVDSTNFGSIVELIIAEEQPVFIAIGIQQDTSTNQMLSRIVDTLYHNSHNNIWKVRKTNATEDTLLLKL